MHPIGIFVPDFTVHSHLQQLSRKQKCTWLTIQFFISQLQILFKIGSGVKKTKEVKASPAGLSLKNTVTKACLRIGSLFAPSLW